MGYAYPAGLQRGTTCEVTVGGQYLQGVTGAICSDPGLVATYVSYKKPLSKKERRGLKDRLKELERMRKEGVNGEPLRLTEKQVAQIAEIRAKLKDPKKQTNVQIDEQVVLRIEATPGTVPGEGELRLISPTGLSNPIRFRVDLKFMLDG